LTALADEESDVSAISSRTACTSLSAIPAIPAVAAIAAVAATRSLVNGISVATFPSGAAGASISSVLSAPALSTRAAIPSNGMQDDCRLISEICRLYLDFCCILAGLAGISDPTIYSASTVIAVTSPAALLGSSIILKICPSVAAVAVRTTVSRLLVAAIDARMTVPRLRLLGRLPYLG
jgi:hypothetical protein